MLKLNNEKYDVFKLYYWHDAMLVGKYRLPQLEATQFLPHDVISFCERKNISHPEEHWVDFFIDDYKFERFWHYPKTSFENLRRYAGIITPDYSMLPEMLPGQIIWNNTRNRVMAYYLQQNGFNIIPTASWCTSDDFDWCFDGLPERASIAVSTNGCLSSHYGIKTFLEGVDELYRQKNPSHLIVCGREMKELEGYGNVVYYYSNFFKRRKEHEC